MNGIISAWHVEALFEKSRAGDVHDSQADIFQREALLGYVPMVSRWTRG